MKTVNLSHPYSDATTFRQTPKGDGIWGDYIFKMNDTSNAYDYFIVLNTTPKVEKFRTYRGHVILWCGEPNPVHKYNENFVKQFSSVITCQREISHPGVFYTQIGSPWFVEKNYDELKKISGVKKNKNISIIVSNKQFTEGHKKRYDFAMKLKEHFKDKIDLFGRGVRDFKDKWEVVSPYKFSIAIENCSVTDYFTEKLTDCYLALTCPIYYGCSNVSDYFDRDSYVSIDIDDFAGSKKVIENVIDDNDYYQNHLGLLRKQKEKCLDEYNIFEVITNFLETNKFRDEIREKEYIIRPEEFFNNMKSSLGSKIKSHLINIKNKIK